MNKGYLRSLESKTDSEILSEIAMGRHGEPTSQMRNSVEAFMQSRKVAAEAESAVKRDAREEETLAIAKEANSIARDALEEARSNAASASRQARWAKWAAIIATTAAIIQAKDEIIKLITSLIP